MPPQSVSIEAVIVGRNDQYEPNWEENLFSAISYNRRLFDGSPIDYRVAFVEWNPLSDRPLLAPRLAASFPFVRGIVVAPEIHAQLCTADGLDLVLTVAFNAGFRTTSANFCLGTCGDIFLSRQIVSQIVHGTLREGCLYRAERVSIRNDIDFAEVTPDLIEDPVNIIGVDTCSEPPYDKPPYTNAAGDFSMLDTGTMFGIRGYDETVTFARLHIDARFGLSALAVTSDCSLLGRIYHISHARSHGANVHRTAGRMYDHLANIPYANSPSWGLASFDWRETGDRVFTVRPPAIHKPGPIPNNAPESVWARANLISGQLNSVRDNLHPARPLGQTSIEADLTGMMAPILQEWGSSADATGGAIIVETGPDQWAYACAFQLGQRSLDPDKHYWVSARISVTRGAIGVGLVRNEQLLQERFAMAEEGPDEIVLSLTEAETEWLIFRNVAEGSTRSVVAISDVRVISQPKAASVPSAH